MEIEVLLSSKEKISFLNYLQENYNFLESLKSYNYKFKFRFIIDYKSFSDVGIEDSKVCKKFFIKFLNESFIDKYINLITLEEFHISESEKRKFFSINEFVLFLLSIKLFPEISIVSSFYNEQKNVDKFWDQLSDLDQIFNIVEYIFVNNGSRDKTLNRLNNLANKDKRIRLYSLEYPSNYSNGYHFGISKATSEYALITHSDCQYDLYTTLKLWLKIIQKDILNLNGNKNIALSKRFNRTYPERIITFINCFLAKILIFKNNYIDFNSQPKIIPTSLFKEYRLPKSKFGFIFDLSLVNHIFKSTQLDKKSYNLLKTIPVIVIPRKEGKSSWERKPISFIIEALDNILFMIAQFLKK